MAVSYLCGWEMGSNAEAPVAQGTVASTQAHTGTYSGAGDQRLYVRTSGGTYATVFQSFRFYYFSGALPAAATSIAGVYSGSSDGVTGTARQFVRLNTNGTVIARVSGVDLATSTNALTADSTWHRFDVDVGYNAGAGIRISVDGTVWVSDASAAIFLGTTLGTLAPTSCFIDDIVCYDSALPATLNGYSVSLLKPVSDSAIGGWTGGAGGTTNLWGAVDNVPPVGVGTASDTNTSQIHNGVSSTTDNYDATCAAYTSITGLTASSQVLAVQSIVNDAQEVTTGSPKAGAVVIASNPTGQTERSFDYGIPNGTTGSTAAAAVGTFPTGWGTHVGPVTENPTITVSSGPVARVGKRVATTRVVAADFLGVYVMWETATTTKAPPMSTRDRLIRRNSLLRR